MPDFGAFLAAFFLPSEAEQEEVSVTLRISASDRLVRVANRLSLVKRKEALPH